MGHDHKRLPSRILAYSPQEDFSSVFTLLSSLHPNRFSTLGFLQATLSRESPTTNIYEHMTLPYNRAWVFFHVFNFGEPPRSWTPYIGLLVCLSKISTFGSFPKIENLTVGLLFVFHMLKFWELPINWEPYGRTLVCSSSFQLLEAPPKIEHPIKVSLQVFKLFGWLPRSWILETKSKTYNKAFNLWEVPKSRKLERENKILL